MNVPPKPSFNLTAPTLVFVRLGMRCVARGRRLALRWLS